MQTGTGITSISSRYIAALQSASALCVVGLAEIWLGGQRLASFTVDASSQLRVDRANVVRRSATLQLTEGVAYADDGSNVPVVPQTPRDVFLPYGAEIALYAGLAYDDGSQELVQVTTGGMEDVVITDTDKDLTVQLSAFDRMKQVQRAGFIDTHTVPPNANMQTEMTRLLNACFPNGVPWDVTNYVPTSFVTPATASVFKPGDDPASKLRDLANSIGYEVFFDAAGVPTMMPVPDPNSAPVSWTYDETQASNLAKEWTRTVSRQKAPNYIIRTGQGSGVRTPVAGTAIDQNPNSPTFIGGPYGRQVDAQSSSLISTTAQGNAAAQAALLVALGTIESLELRAFPKVDTRVDDVVMVNRARSGIASQLYVLDSFTLGFGSAGIIDAIGRQIGSIP